MRKAIFKKNCTIGASTTSMVFHWPAAAHHGPTCVGEGGTTSLGNTVFTSFCTGNNWGWLVVNGAKRNFGQDQSTYFGATGARITQVHISNWGSSFKCLAY